jgi:hypothetical protein
VVTVSLPAYRAGEIMWLALEGLARQVDAPPWELVIAEEEREAFGLERVGEYVPRLEAAGCVQVQYHALDKRVVLARKWRQLALRSAETSEVFCLHGADDYSHSTRLAETYQAFLDNADDEVPVVWVQYAKGHFACIGHRRIAVFDYLMPGYEEQKHTAVNMAAATRFVRQACDSDYATGVDGWLYGEALRAAGGRGKKINLTEGWEGSLFTDGFNVCSLDRTLMVTELRPPFFETEKTLHDILPEDVATRLDTLAVKAIATSAERQIERAVEGLVNAVKALRAAST